MAEPRLFGRLPDQYFATILAAARRARAEPGPPLVDLGRGNPDLPPPPHALAAVHAALEETATPAVHGYPPFRGHRFLHEAIADRYRADHGVDLDPEREVAVVPGTKTGIMLATMAGAGPGETVLLPDPGYPDYHSAVALADARVAPLALEASAGWQPDLEAAPPGALLVLNYPSNPCAVCERPGTFEAAVAFAHRHGAVLLHDFAYGFLTFDDRRGRSVLEVPGAREVAVELWSPSKIYGMAGWRIGFVVGCAAIVARINTLIDHLTAGVFTALQRGLEAALRSDQADVADRRDAYRARRDRLVARLHAAGADLQPPEGTFYAWWRPPAGVTAESLLREQRLAVAPGGGFGSRGRAWVRLSLALPDADVEEGAERLVAALARRAEAHAAAGPRTARGPAA